MDKVRAFMKVAWTQRFWILSVVGVLAAVICWSMASGNLQRQFTANKTQIDGKFGEMTAITGKQIHGNEVVNAKEREEAKKIANSVKELWQSLFDAQREEVLKWPDVLGDDFVDYVKNAKFDSQIKPDFRDRYQNYIKNRFEGLVKIVDAKKMAVDGTAGFGAAPGREGAFPGGAAPGAEVELDAQGMPIEENYLVQWGDQGTLRQQLEFVDVPTARQIWVTQEDLWVYETLLRAIANTNKERGATRPDNTAISVIQSLQVGAPAALAMAQESTILLPVEAMATGGEMMSPEGTPMGREGEMGAGGAESLDAMLLANRYIDAEGKPIPDASSGAGVEFRRLPIRMMLSMDERYLPKILVECANAPLPVEVQRLRINAEKSGTDKDNQAFTVGAAASAGGMGGGMPMGRGMEGGMGRSMGMPMGRGMEGGMGGVTLTPVEIPNMVTVDIQGVVYIYNPPDAAVLTVPGDDAAASGSETLAAGDAGVVR
ncbi:hypothetical protein [Lacipirellula parvula]|uniref:Uncharacterized protein n=1 Tax=Lacipirellula parvula TaxID=2650471 RepID=A0A5K7XBU8_9BACT|nr:hypothetical protein [Lacipirellula parvula]BBO31806.1 hypothetical protein PLANPX_1418 [Lacipirellula parvula]